MKRIAVLLSVFVVLVTADQHLNANGPFGKRHRINSEPSPYACKRPDGYSSPVAAANLNVSATSYTSNEQITVTWSPLSAWCKDDFIGVYFAEIPLQDGE